MINCVLKTILATSLLAKYIHSAVDNTGKEGNQSEFDSLYNAVSNTGIAQIIFCDQEYFKNYCQAIDYNVISTSICYTSKYLGDVIMTPDAIKSINLRGKCLRIFDTIGCIGDSKILHPMGNCHMALPTCGWKGRVRSFSPCNATLLPKSENAVSLRGDHCLTNCVPSRYEFTCTTDFDDNEPCFPHPQQNSIGQYCCQNCSIPDFWNTTNAVIYDKHSFNGRGLELHLSGRTPCMNIPSEYTGVSGSLTTKASCLWFYHSNDCTGDPAKQAYLIKYFSFRFDYQSIGLCNVEQATCVNSICKHDDTILNGLPVVAAAGNSTRKIIFLEKNVCLNLYLNFPLTKVIVSRRGHCLNVFDSVGCTEGIGIVRGLHHSFIPNVHPSVMYCNSTLGRVYSQPEGVTGKPCLTPCSVESETKKFFTCRVGPDVGWDLCSPREGMDSIGSTCSGNCTRNHLPHMVTLHQLPNFKGRSLRIYHVENQFCHDLGRNNSWINKYGIGSIDFHGNCIYLYESIGCNKNDPSWAAKYNHLADEVSLDHRLGWKSLRFCTDGLPYVSEVQCGISGAKCLNKCMERNESYPNCATNNSTQEPCYPRDGFDMFSESVCLECGCPNKDGPIQLIIYKDPVFAEQRVHVRQQGLKQCYNLGFDHEMMHNFYTNSTSLRLFNLKCIRLHEKIGCSGLTTTVYADLHNMSKCHNSSGCQGTWWKSPKSLSLCDTILPAPFDNALSLSGKNCTNECKAREDVFQCNTNVRHLEFCIPRVNQNHLGQGCIHDNCVFDKPNQRAAMRLKEMAFPEINSKTCYNINETIEDALTKKVFPYLKANGICFILYNRFGCTGNFQVSSSQCKINGSCLLTNASSVRFCSAYLPEEYQMPLGSSGKFCKSTCAPSIRRNFCCQLYDGSFDACSPRPEHNFRGDFCETNCSLQDPLDWSNPNFYTCGVKGFQEILGNRATALFCIFTLYVHLHYCLYY